MIIYVDTSLLLSPFRIGDENYKFMGIINSKKHIQIVTGTLAIVEITSVLLREVHLFNTALKVISEDDSLGEISLLSLQLQVRLAIKYILQYYRVKVLEDYKPEESNILVEGCLISPIFKLLINSTIKSKLRTIDLLHYYTASYYSNIKELKIDYLITSYYTFQKMRDVFGEESSLTIISPETFIEKERVT